MRRIVMVCFALFLCSLAGCGEDFKPPELETTGESATFLGQQMDLVVRLPNLSYPGRGVAPTRLEVRFDFDEAGPGRREARVIYERAVAGGEVVPVADLSSGMAVVTVVDKSWRTGRIGPIEVDGVIFEYMLDGTLDAEGWHLSGDSWESLTGGEGSSEGWRRHRFLVAGTDYLASGRVELVEVVRGNELRVQHRLERISPDPIVRTSRDAVMVINRLSYDNIQRLDPRREFRTSWQATTAIGSNPQDALLVDDEKLYVSRYEPPFHDLAVMDSRTGAIIASVPLAELAENPDGYPRASRLAAAGGVVFVGLQDIDRTFSRYGEAKLAVVDPQTDELLSGIHLPGKNPGRIEVIKEESGLKLYVALTGIFPGNLPQELSGGVAVVDVANRAFERWALDDDTVAGNVIAMAIASNQLGYVVVSDEHFISRVVSFDPRDGRVLGTLVETASFLPELALSGGGLLAVPDRAWLAPSLCLYSPGQGTGPARQPLGCVGLELAPASVVSLDP